MNCGGGGSCGTCIVEVNTSLHLLWFLSCIHVYIFICTYVNLEYKLAVQILEGKDVLNERTNTEARYLKKVRR